MRLPRSNAQRQVTTRRSMLPGSAGGQSDMVAPAGATPRLATGPMEGPLPPWGVQGAGTWHASPPWYGVYADDASATAHIGPSMQFGLYSSDPGGIIFLADTANPNAGAVGMETDTAEAIITARMGAHGEFFVGVNPTTSVMQLVDGASSSEVSHVADAGVASTDVIANGDHIITHVQNDGTAEYSWIEISESITAVPNATAARGRLFVKDNGSGKKQLCAIFPSGAAIVLATEP